MVSIIILTRLRNKTKDMKITICGSMKFSGKMLETKKELEKNGHIAYIPCDTEDHVKDEELKDKFDNDLENELKHCFEKDVLRDGFDNIEKSDAIIHLNYPKNGIDGYIGPSGLMEIGVSFHLKKKIYLMNEVNKNQKWALEVLLTKPIILNGNLGKIGI